MIRDWADFARQAGLPPRKCRPAFGRPPAHQKPPPKPETPAPWWRVLLDFLARVWASRKEPEL